MAQIEKNLIHFNTDAAFQTHKEDIKNTAIAFIKDGQKIYTHGKIYEAVPEGGTEGQVLVRDKDGKLVWQNNTIIRNGENGPIITDIIVYDDGSDDDGMLTKSVADTLYQPVLPEGTEGQMLVMGEEGPEWQNTPDSYDDTSLKNRIKALEDKGDYGVSDLEERVETLEAIDHEKYVTKDSLESTLEEYYTQDDVDELLDEKQPKFNVGTGLELEDGTLSVTLDTTIFKVVESLPTQPATGDANKLHLVLSTTSETGNLYEEYLYVNNKWELLGKFKAEVDLTPYLKIEDIEEEVSDAGFAKTTEVASAIEASWSWAEY